MERRFAIRSITLIMPVIMLIGACTVLPAACQEDAGGAATPAASQPAADPVPATTAAPPGTGAPADTAAPATTAAPGTEPAAAGAGEDEHRVAEAEALIREMVAAYQAAPCFTDHIVRSSYFLNRDNPLKEFQVSFGKGKDAYLDEPEGIFACIDGVVYTSYRRRPERYVREEMDEDVLRTAQRKWDAYYGLLRLHCTLRYGHPLNEIVDAMGLDMLVPTKISSYRRITKQGRELEAISLMSRLGSSVIYVDPETKFIVEAEADFTPDGSPEGVKVGTFITCHPQVHDELPEPITFDTEGKCRVEGVGDLLSAREPDCLPHGDDP